VEAPFDFKFSPNVTTYNRKDLGAEDIQGIFKKTDPDLVFFAGWGDEGYNSLFSILKPDQISLLGFDNSYDQSIKQELKALYFKLFKRKNFDYCFVPGIPQKSLALKMGFTDKQILTGAYTADVDKFNTYFELRKNSNTGSGKFLYLGRYIKRKGIFDLWKAYQKYREKGGLWELYCIGTGSEWDNRYEGEGVTHFGFKQPHEIFEVIKDCTAYILPSHFEPWGVSVHEMAAVGMPMILSNQIISGTQFLVSNENGFSFQSGNVDDLCEKMITISGLSEQRLIEFGKKSHEKAQENTPQIWVNNVLSLLTKK
tara:strand:+ start:288 stop:1223 length:936 start_codon:yes stop_codon:yes gene_type:complete